eukprot:TRINITY_DN4118_c1_g1_i4.p1 TRINITY_DN4118_c1_g1~~TRINITY_DN4118_c1_g1_i4.p1  ORF type:complete len:340 (+),score=92.03 TRINITY_DN4118_c1_g1_i4:96-1115(+)
MDILDEIERLGLERKNERNKEETKINNKNDLPQSKVKRKKKTTVKKDNDSHQKLREEIKYRIEKEKETFKRQQLLVDGGHCTSSVLIDCALHFQKGHYDDVVTERSLSRECGYPICSNSLPIVDPKKTTPKYRISSSKKQVFDLSEMGFYCSEECLIASKFLSSQLLDTPVHLRTIETMSPVTLLPTSHFLETNRNEMKKENNEPKQVEDQLSELRIIERDPTPLAKEEKETIQMDYKSIEGVEVEVSMGKSKKTKSETETSDDWLLKRKALVPELGFFGTLHVTLGNWITHQSKLFLKGVKETQNVELLQPVEEPNVLNQTSDEFMLKKNALFSMATL